MPFLNQITYLCLMISVMLFSCQRQLGDGAVNSINNTALIKSEGTEVESIENHSYSKSEEQESVDPFFANEKQIDNISYKVISVKNEDESDKLEYYRFRINLTEGGKYIDELLKSNPNKDKLASYLANENKNNFSIDVAGKISDCTYYTKVESGNVVGFLDIILGFSTNSENEGIRTIVYNDKLGGNGPIKMKLFPKK